MSGTEVAGVAALTRGRWHSVIEPTAARAGSATRRRLCASRQDERDGAAWRDWWARTFSWAGPGRSQPHQQVRPTRRSKMPDASRANATPRTHANAEDARVHARSEARLWLGALWPRSPW